MKQIQKNELNEIKLINCIISECGINACKIQNDELWTISINIIAWREVNNTNTTDEINTKKIKIIERVTYNNYIKISKLISIDKINSISIKLNNLNNNLNEFKGQLIDIHEYKEEEDTRDEKLNKFLQDYKEPTIINDEKLGCSFEYDKKIECYNSEIEWINNNNNNNDKIGITLNIPINEYNNFIEKIYKLIKDKFKWESKYQINIINNLLNLKNNDWIDEDDILDSDSENNGENIKFRKINESEFLNRIKLTNISINFDLSIEFWFDDGNLFFGHIICSYGDLKNGCINSSEILG